MLTFELAKLLRMMLRVKNVVACMGVWVYGCMGVWVDGMMALKTAAVSHSPIHPSTHPQNFPRIIYGQLILLFLLPVFLSAGPKGFSGYWHSTFGHIQIEVSGKRATGVYNDGEVEGRLEGRISADGNGCRFFERTIAGLPDQLAMIRETTVLCISSQAPSGTAKYLVARLKVGDLFAHRYDCTGHFHPRYGRPSGFEQSIHQAD